METTTPTQSANKNSRFEMRLSQEQRSRIDQAAELQGMSASQWALSNLMDAADRDIREAHMLRLSDESWNAFITALDGPMPDQLVRLLQEEPIWK